MKTMFLLVLAVAGLTFSSALVGEVLVNRDTGEVRVEDSNPWSLVNAFEDEAFRNPGKEVPVWSSNHIEKVDFFHSRWVKTATNVVVYRDEKIQSLAKEVKEDGVIFFLLYKMWMIVAIMIATGSIVAVKSGKLTLVVLAGIFATLAATVVTLVLATVFATIATVVCTATAIVSFVVAVVVIIVSNYPRPTVVEKLLSWFFIGIFYVSALVALIL